MYGGLFAILGRERGRVSACYADGGNKTEKTRYLCTIYVYGMLEFIFITILVIWLMGVLGRFLLRRWIARKQREFARQFGGAQYGGRTSGRKNNRREGEVSVQQTAPAEKKVSKAVGDYVEFEEVEITEEITEDE